MAKSGHSEKSPFSDDIIHYDDKGNKIGRSTPDFFGGGYTNYDKNGNKIGRTEQDFFGGGYTNYDKSGNKIGRTEEDFFGGYITYDSSGNRLSSSAPGVFGGFPEERADKENDPTEGITAFAFYNISSDKQNGADTDIKTRYKNKKFLPDPVAKVLDAKEPITEADYKNYKRSLKDIYMGSSGLYFIFAVLGIIIIVVGFALPAVEGTTFARLFLIIAGAFFSIFGILGIFCEVIAYRSLKRDLKALTEKKDGK